MSSEVKISEEKREVILRCRGSVWDQILMAFFLGLPGWWILNRAYWMKWSVSAVAILSFGVWCLVMAARAVYRTQQVLDYELKDQDGVLSFVEGGTRVKWRIRKEEIEGINCGANGVLPEIVMRDGRKLSLMLECLDDLEAWRQFLVETGLVLLEFPDDLRVKI